MSFKALIRNYNPIFIFAFYQPFLKGEKQHEWNINLRNNTEKIGFIHVIILVMQVLI